MKSNISSIDLHYLLKEMQFLEGARVDKVYHPRKEELLFQFHVASKGKQLLRVISGKFIFLSEYKENYDSPSGFCMFLRKKLSNSRLREIQQEHSERVVRLVFENKEGKLNLYIELFGKGNIILADSKNNIINALQQQKWKDREIKKGLGYVFPKKEFELFKISKNEFCMAIDSNSQLVMKLAKDIGLGGTYSEELCILSGIGKNKKRLSKAEKESLYSSFSKIIAKKISPFIIYQKNSIKDIVPFELEIYKNLEKKSLPSFNSAFDFFFKEEYAEKEEFVSKHQQLIDKTNKIIEQQKGQIKNLEKKSEQNNRKGELIYENYTVIEQILRELNKARQKYSFSEIKEKLKGHNVIKSIDEKDKKIIINI
ncbi:hypothetical protein GF323_04580 [Candidatus Woesearchaeota archaeon]|nr:hypothetical protein [Candidatus Woesearchaeota archaeon]